MPKGIEPNKPLCGAKLRKKNRTCKHRAGRRTHHEGVGHCWMHGGRTENVLKHRYANIKSKRLTAIMAEFENEKDPLDLMPEAKLLRAMAIDLYDRWEEIYGPDGALLAWYNSFGEENRAPKPRQMPDITALSTMIDRVGAMVDRIVKHKQEGAITLQTLTRLLEQFGIETAQSVAAANLKPDVESRLLTDIEHRWKSVKV